MSALDEAYAAWLEASGNARLEPLIGGNMEGAFAAGYRAAGTRYREALELIAEGEHDHRVECSSDLHRLISIARTALNPQMERKG